MLEADCRGDRKLDEALGAIQLNFTFVLITLSVRYKLFGYFTAISFASTA